MSPIVNTFAGISILPLGFTRGSAAAKSFIAKVTTNASQSWGCSVSAVGDKVYLSVTDRYYSPYRFTQIRLNDDLTLANNYGDTNSSGSAYVMSLAPDATGVSYLTTFPKNGSSWFTTIKTNANGTLAWERQYTGVGNQGGMTAIGESGNVYSTTSTGNGSQSIATPRTAIIKYNSSGTIQWQRSLTSGYGADGSHGMAVSQSTGNIYKAWSGASSAGASWPYVTKINSSGTAQWTMRWPIGSAVYHSNSNIAIDASENVYHAIGDGTLMYLTKFDTSGTVQWRRQYSLSGVGFLAPVLTVDASGNSYLINKSSSAIYVIKYNSSGTIQWQRSMTRSGGNLTIETPEQFSFYADAGTVMFSGRDGHSYFFRMPADGSKTGSHVLNGETFTWAAVSGTDSANTTTWTSQTISTGTPSGTDAGGSHSFASATYTIGTKVI